MSERISNPWVGRLKLNDEESLICGQFGELDLALLRNQINCARVLVRQNARCACALSGTFFDVIVFHARDFSLMVFVCPSRILFSQRLRLLAVAVRSLFTGSSCWVMASLLRPCFVRYTRSIPSSCRLIHVSCLWRAASESGGGHA